VAGPLRQLETITGLAPILVIEALDEIEAARLARVERRGGRVRIFKSAAAEAKALQHKRRALKSRRRAKGFLLSEVELPDRFDYQVDLPRSGALQAKRWRDDELDAAGLLSLRILELVDAETQRLQDVRQWRFVAAVGILGHLGAITEEELGRALEYARRIPKTRRMAGIYGCLRELLKERAEKLAQLLREVQLPYEQQFRQRIRRLSSGRIDCAPIVQGVAQKRQAPQKRDATLLRRATR
jgi:hypothetical protein